MLILTALEPRLYSEAIGDALGERRPHLEVNVVEPDTLGSEVAHPGPKLVLCSQPRPGVSLEGLAWIEYHPFNSAIAIIHAGGQRLELDVASLADLISAVDLAEDLM